MNCHPTEFARFIASPQACSFSKHSAELEEPFAVPESPTLPPMKKGPRPFPPETCGDIVGELGAGGPRRLFPIS